MFNETARNAISGNYGLMQDDTDLNTLTRSSETCAKYYTERCFMSKSFAGFMLENIKVIR
jgi:hypothetical protein